MSERKYNSEQQEEFIQFLKNANKSLVVENRKIRKLLRLAEDDLNRTKTESHERKQSLDSITAELSKTKRKLRRMENSK